LGEGRKKSHAFLVLIPGKEENAHGQKKDKRKIRFVGKKVKPFAKHFLRRGGMRTADTESKKTRKGGGEEKSPAFFLSVSARKKKGLSAARKKKE